MTEISGQKNKNKVLIVSLWEFNRWFKIKDQVKTLIITVIISLVFFGGRSFIEKHGNKEINIAILNQKILPLSIGKENNIKIVEKKGFGKEELERLVEKGEIDGLLIINNTEEAELIVNKEPIWINQLKEKFVQASFKKRITLSGIPREKISELLKPGSIKVIYGENSKKPVEIGVKIAAGMVIALMIFGIFLSFSYQFVAITGEKQQHVTELIISAISPQTWIDGKIIGLSLLSLVSVFNYIISATIFVFIANSFGSGWNIPMTLSNPVLLGILIILGIGGFLFWNTFFTGFAATINDPNTSTKSSLMFLPILPVGLAFAALKNPDSLLMKILSLFPLTSPPALAGRLVLSTVPLWETIVALILLFGSIWYLRKAAGKVFAAAILMYGKEPSFKEMFSWMKRTS
jgi:ABC-2 type transport system permease protein